MLRLPPVSWMRPASLAEALSALAAEPHAKALAGGTDLLATLKFGSDPRLRHGCRLLSLTALPLSGIRSTDAGWEIGATTTLWDLARWRPPEGALGVLPEAAHQVGAPPIRSRATLGGNLCLDTRCFFYNQSAFWRSSRPACFKAGGSVCHVAPGGGRCHACHQADLPPVLIALDASARIEAAAGPKTVPVGSLYSGDGKSPLALPESELLVGVSIPRPPAGSGAAWEKIRVRKGLDFAMASAAVFVQTGEEGTCCGARVVLGAVGSGPIRVEEAERILEGTRLEPDVLDAAADEARKAARPAKNVDLTPAYRRQVAGVAVTRAARRAWARALQAPHAIPPQDPR